MLVAAKVDQSRAIARAYRPRRGGHEPWADKTKGLHPLKRAWTAEVSLVDRLFCPYDDCH